MMLDQANSQSGSSSLMRFVCWPIVLMKEETTFSQLWPPSFNPFSKRIIL